MALYKVTKAEDAFQYFPAGHYDVRCTRLHTADDLEGGKLTLGLSHFLPQGGAEMAEATLEMCYYIQAGEILEGQGKKAEALKLYQKVKAMESYSESSQYVDMIDEYIARVAE